MSIDKPFPILLRDNCLVAIHKPPGILMHRSPISRDRVFVLQQLRDQIGQRVYPVHRLDRATSGVLLFGLTAAAAQTLVRQFEARSVEKEYLALARGWVDDQGTIDHPVADEEGDNVPREAITDYRCLQRGELPFEVDRYPTSRYSLVSVSPRTGRRQQIRRHFKHISHHLVGDTTHGNGRHNRLFRDRYAIHRLMLTAQRLVFYHPASGERIDLRAGAEHDWQRVFQIFDWSPVGDPADIIAP